MIEINVGNLYEIGRGIMRRLVLGIGYVFVKYKHDLGKVVASSKKGIKYPCTEWYCFKIRAFADILKQSVSAAGRAFRAWWVILPKMAQKFLDELNLNTRKYLQKMNFGKK